MPWISVSINVPFNISKCPYSSVRLAIHRTCDCVIYKRVKTKISFIFTKLDLAHKVLIPTWQFFEIIFNNLGLKTSNLKHRFIEPHVIYDVGLIRRKLLMWSGMFPCVVPLGAPYKQSSPFFLPKLYRISKKSKEPNDTSLIFFYHIWVNKTSFWVISDVAKWITLYSG